MSTDISPPSAGPLHDNDRTEHIPSRIRLLVEEELAEGPDRGWPHGRDKENAPWLLHPKEDLYGLALSGGGIRSATYNLGLLQALDRVGLLKHFHYLSTVSGGGYVGGWWTRWRAWQSKSECPEDGVFPRKGADQPDPEHRAVRHLRQYSNFLTPRLGVFSWDTGRMVVSAVSAMIPSLLVSVSVLVLVLCVWMVALTGMVGPWIVMTAGPGLVSADASAVARVAAAAIGAGAGLLFSAAAVRMVNATTTRAASELWAIPATAAGAAVGWYLAVSMFPPSTPFIVFVTAATLTVCEGKWRQRGENGNLNDYAFASFLALLVTALAWTALWPRPESASWLPGFAPDGSVPSWTAGMVPQSANTVGAALLFVFTPALAWGAAVVVFVVLRTLVSSRMKQITNREVRSAFDRVQARLILLVVAWTLLAAAWVLGVILAAWWAERSIVHGSTLVGLLTTLTAAYAAVQGWIAKQGFNAADSRWRERIKPILPQVFAYAVLILLWLLLIASIGPSVAGLSPRPVASVFGVALLIVVLGFLTFNPNEVGIHGFYRSRLVRAFTGACNDERFSGKTEECDGDDVLLGDIRFGSGGPRVHLICCAANDLDSTTAMKQLNRGATSATLSNVGFSVGDRFCTWNKYDQGRGAPPSLGAAMTASGAAFNTLLGWRSVRFGPAATFLLAALNLRLGLWLPHPDPPGERKAQRWSPGGWLRQRPGFPFFKEMFSSASATDTIVHLSDGGHFENLAVYELIRRHCRVIVVSDCGQDGTGDFEDLGRLCRHVRVDFGVDIRIDVSPLRPGPDGRSRQHMVAGDIHYPDGDTGVLLYFKPSLVGSEPTDVFHYKTQNAEFPHESTLDQFYDEAQWEAYRRLGEHAGMMAFRTVSGDLSIDDAATAAEVFGRARREWKAARAGLEGGLAVFRSGSAELDELLRSPENSLLQRQVYPELASGSVQVPGLFSTARPNGLRVPPKDASASAADVAESELFTLRQMLLLLNELYVSEELEFNHSHPVYLGVTNFFRRWATAERMSYWWPVLKPQFSPQLGRFVENRLGTEPLSMQETVVDSESLYGGIDLLRGHVAHPEDVRCRTFSLWQRLGNERAPSRHVRVACLHAVPISGQLAWRASDLVIADGLWGVGIGHSFLIKLRTHLASVGQAEPGTAVRELFVRLERARDASAAEKQALATTMQLYRSVGFREITPVDSLTISGPPRPPLLEWHKPGDRPPGPRLVEWMHLEVEPCINKPGSDIEEARHRVDLEVRA